MQHVTRTSLARRARRNRTVSSFVGIALIAVVVTVGVVLMRLPDWNTAEALVDEWALAHLTPTTWRIALVFAAAFEPEVVAALGVLLAIAVALLVRGLRPVERIVRGAIVLTLVGVPAVTTEALKHVVQRPRPALAEFDVVPPESWSYPSGHTAGATALVLTLLFLLRLGGPRRAVTIAAWTVGAVVVLAVAASRIALGVHYPTDTVAAMLATTGVFLVLRAVVLPVLPRRAATVRG